MKSIIFGLSLAGAATAQFVNGMSYVAAPTNYAAPPSQVTQAPSDFYQQMPYDAFQSGGYKSLECGYGYYKGSDGSCMTESWVI